MKATVNGGIGIHYLVEGKEGAPWITFSNSLATDFSMWDEEVDALKDDYRILRYDKRGHGLSEAPEGPYDFDMLIGDVIGLWDELGIEKSHFVGLSIGGMTALGLALAHPNRVSSIVVSNSRADATPEFKEAWDQRISMAEANGMEGMAEPTVQRWCSKPFLDSGTVKLERLANMVRATSLTGFKGCGRAIQGLNYHSRLGEIKSPTLYIAGKEDGGTPADNMRRMHGDHPGSQFVELSPAGHISVVEQPEAHSKAVREFLASVG